MTMMAQLGLAMPVWLTIFLAGTGHAAADQARAEVVLVGEPQRAELLRASIIDLLATEPIAVVLSQRIELDPAEILAPPTASGAQPSTARVWIDVARPPAVRIYLADDTGRRFAARSLAFAPLDVAAEETISQIVRSSIKALLDPATPALDAGQMKREVETMVRASAPRPAPPPAADVPTGLEARGSWVGSGALGDGAVTHAAWLTLSLLGGGNPDLRWWAWLGGGYAFPWSIDEGGELGARLSLAGARAGFGLQLGLGLGSRLHARVGLGGGADRLTVSPRGDVAGYEIAAQQAVTLGALRGSVGLGLRLYGPISAALVGHLDWAPRARLTSAEHAGILAVSASRRLRPAVELGLAWEL